MNGLESLLNGRKVIKIEKKNSLMSWIRFDFTMFLNDDVLCTLYAMNRDTFFCVCAVIAFHWWIHVVGGPSLRSTFHRTIIIHEREWKKNIHTRAPFYIWLELFLIWEHARYNIPPSHSEFLFEFVVHRLSHSTVQFNRF